MANYILKFVSGQIGQDDIDRPTNQGHRTELMKSNHDKGEPVYCCCRGETPLPKIMVVLKGKTLFLRRYADTSQRHASDCVFSEPPRENVRKNEYRPGVEETAEGDVTLTLDTTRIFPLRKEMKVDKAEGAEIKDVDPDKKNKPTTQRGVLTQLGILRYLIERVDFNCWKPPFRGARNSARLYWRVAQAAAAVTVGKRNPVALSGVLFVPRGGEVIQEDLYDFLQSSRVADGQGNYEGLVLGELKRIRDTKREGQMLIGLDWYRCPFFCSKEEWKKMVDRFPLALRFDERGDALNKIAVILTVRYQNNGQSVSMTVTNLAAMRLTEDYIPVESQYEERFSNYLVENRREFEKPIRYQQEDEVFPDFVLTDTPGYMRCEVWGRDDPNYLERMEEKRAIALRDGVRLLEWNAIKNEPLPQLPMIRSGTNQPGAASMAPSHDSSR